MKVFFSNYHISVNGPLVQDLLACGYEVVVPSHAGFATKRISFFAPNDEHKRYPGVTMVDWVQYLQMDPMLMIIPCTQMVDDLLKIHEQRKEAGKEDVIVLLTANSDHQPAWRRVPTDHLLSHDLTYHREFTGKYKMLYFSRPTILRPKKTADELRRSYDQRKVKLYINNLEHDKGLKPELAAAKEMQAVWQSRTGWKMPLYGYGNGAGWPSMRDTQNHIVDSMFTFVSKRRETWGQLINESMQLGTPGMFLRGLLNSTFTEYLINDDTAIVGDTVEELVDKALSLSYEGYQTLVNEAYSQSQMFCNEDIRREKLGWLLGKAAAQLVEKTGANDPT